jgi:periplasmic protein TonB
MVQKRMSRKFTVTIWQAFAISVVLHAALALPYMLHTMPSDPEEPPRLVLEFQGVASDNQTEQKIMRETAAQQTQAPAEHETEVTRTEVSEQPPTEEQAPAAQPAPVEQKQEPTPKPEAKSADGGANNTPGAEQSQIAQTLKVERQIDQEYGIRVSKKIQSNVIYSEDGVQGSTAVSFTILQSGRIRPETLKIAASSGHAKLDANALKTVRACVPFAPPPREMTVTVNVDFWHRP